MVKERVEFFVVDTQKGKQAVDVVGVDGTKLICEK